MRKQCYSFFYFKIQIQSILKLFSNSVLKYKTNLYSKLKVTLSLNFLQRALFSAFLTSAVIVFILVHVRTSDSEQKKES